MIPYTKAPKVAVYCSVDGCIHNIQGSCNLYQLKLSVDYDNGIPPNRKKIATCTPTYPSDWAKWGNENRLTNNKLIRSSASKLSDEK